MIPGFSKGLPGFYKALPKLSKTESELSKGPGGFYKLARESAVGPPEPSKMKKRPSNVPPELRWHLKRLRWHLKKLWYCHIDGIIALIGKRGLIVPKGSLLFFKRKPATAPRLHRTHRGCRPGLWQCHAGCCL